MSYIYDLVDTWASGGGPYTSIKMNATDNDTGSASLLMDLQVGGASRFKVGKIGTLEVVTGNGQDAIWTGFGTSSFGSSIAVNGTKTLSSIALRGATVEVSLRSTGVYAWTNNSQDALATIDTILTRKAAANLRFGAADAAAPVAQTLSVQSVVAGTTNTAGTNLTITGSQGTGNAAGGSIIFQVAPLGSSGSAQNALADALTIQSDRSIRLNSGVIFGATGSTGPLVGGNNVWEFCNTSSTFPSIRASSGTGLFVASDLYFGFNSATYFTSGSVDTRLYRDAANTLALRNGTAAQLFRVYSTYNGTNDAYGAIGAAVNLDGTAGDANTLYIGSQKKGSPTALTKLAIQVDGTTRLDYGITNAGQWWVNGALGSSGVITGTGVFSTTDLRATATGSIYWNTRSQMTSPADGNLVISNLAVSDFGRLMFGGTSASFPALKRVSANLQVIAADNTASAGLIVGNQALATTATDGFLYVPTCAGTPTGTPTAQTGTVPIVVDTTNNKLYFYSNAAWRDAGP